MANRSFDSRRGLTTSPYIAVVVTVLIVASLALSAQSSTPNDQAAADAASKRAADRIRALQKESDALASQERTLLVELRKLEVDRELKTEELANAERELRQTRERVAVTSVRAAALQNSAETERPEVERRLVDLYKLGQAGYWRLLLDVDNLRSIGRVYRTAAALNRLDRERVLVWRDPQVAERALVPVREPGAAHHLRADEPGAETASLAAKRLHTDARHRRQDEPRGDLHVADVPAFAQVDFHGLLMVLTGIDRIRSCRYHSGPRRRVTAGFCLREAR